MTTGQRVFSWLLIATALYLLGAGVWLLVAAHNWVACALCLLCTIQFITLLGAFKQHEKDSNDDDNA